MNKLIAFLALPLLCFGNGPVLAQAEKPVSFEVKPVLLDTGSSSGMTLALDYDLKAKYTFAGGATGVGQQTFSVKELDRTVRKSGQFDLRARGTLAATADKNPNKLLDVAAAVALKLDTAPAYFTVGALFTYETDQSFDNRQHLFGIAGSATKGRIFVPGDTGTILLNYGGVRPTVDKERQKALGALDSYRRWNLEVSYSLPINKSKLRSLDIDYRHYQETGAPPAVRLAGLDRHRLGLIRANLDQDFFLQYSRGSLPFDQRSERVVKLGWSMKLP